MPAVHPNQFGNAVVSAAQALTKSAGNSAISTVAGGHSIVFTGEAPNQEVAFPQPMAKAHISGYTRKDGTRVEHYERHATVSAKPQAKLQPQQPAATSPKATQDALQGHHASECAKHEKHAATKGHQHPNFGAHVELAALHQASMRHVRRAVAATTNAERENVLSSYAHLQRQIADKSHAITSGAAPAIPATQTMAKASAKPVLFRKTKSPAPQRGIDLSGLLGEMQRAQANAA